MGTRRESPLLIAKAHEIMEAAREGSLKLNSKQQNSPPGIREFVWDKCTFRDIMEIASNPGMSDWFSDIFRSSSRFELHLRIVKDAYGSWNCTVEVKTNGKTEWITIFEASNPNKYMIYSCMFRIINQVPFLRNKPWSKQAQFKYIEWLVELFQSPVHDIDMDGRGMASEDFVRRSTLLNAQSVSFDKCQNMDVLRNVLEERQGRNLKTSISSTHFVGPFLSDVKCLANVSLTACSLDLKNIDFRSFLNFAVGLDSCSGVRVETPEIVDKNFSVLKRKLKLVGNVDRSRSTPKPQPGKSGYRTYHSESLKCRFFINESGVYTKMEVDLPSRRARRN